MQPNDEERRKQMKYTRPEVLILSNAMESIERTTKGDCAVDAQTNASIGAYEADE
jgi:hypothetical protein